MYSISYRSTLYTSWERRERLKQLQTTAQVANAIEYRAGGHVKTQCVSVSTNMSRRQMCKCGARKRAGSRALCSHTTVQRLVAWDVLHQAERQWRRARHQRRALQSAHIRRRGRRRELQAGRAGWARSFQVGTVRAGLSEHTRRQLTIHAGVGTDCIVIKWLNAVS